MNADRAVRWATVLAAAVAIVAALVIVLTAPRPEVPCADPFGPGGTVTHLWCQAPAGVTP